MADRNALARATDQSSSPTPGYLYNDIAKQTASSPSIASETLTYLIRRLAKNNPHVKYKALKTIAMVSTNPNSRGVFKRTVMQDHNAMKDIKDCLNYRGKSDAIHGDQLSERVRTQAKETLDYVYSEDHPSQSQSSSGGGGGGGGMSSGGYGAPSSGYGGGGMGGGHSGGGYGSSNGGYGAGNTSHNNGGGMPVPSGPKRMEGIGNPMFKDPRMEAGATKTMSEMTVTDVMQTAKEGLSVAKSGFVGILKDPLARRAAAASGPGGMNGPSVGGMGGGYGGNGSGGGYGGGGGGYGAPPASQSSWNAPPGQAQLTSSTNGQWTMASNRGPNSISSQDTYRGGGNNISSGIGGSWGGSGGGGTSVAAQGRTPQFNTNNHTSVVNISGHPGAANTSGTFEKNLIMELCPPGGMKPEPPADTLQSFCQSLPDLNSDLVCPALLDMLEDGQPWIIRAKVLCVMERCVQVGDEMVRNNAGVGSNAYADFFHMCSEEIKPLANHSRIAVRMPARRVLKVLGLDAPADNFAAPQAGGGRIGAGAGAVAPKMPVAVAPAPNLLDFDEAPAVPAGSPPPIPSEAPPAPVAVPPPVPDMAPPAPPTASGGDIFGGMTMKSTPAPVPVPAPVPTPAVEHNLFGVVDVKPTPTSTPAPAAPSMFGDMVVKSTTADVLSVATDAGKENVDNGAQPSAEAPAAGSGFTFLNAGGAAPGAAETQKAVAPKQSFDPLLNAPAPQQQQSPAMANMSPQMVAVMQQQQQQILMMQAQMQQMQMGVSGAGGQRMVPGVGVAGMNVNMNLGGMGGIPNQQPPRMGVMGGMGGSGVSTSFAFMEDPSKVKKEETNKKFDFVMDAMKGAK